MTEAAKTIGLSDEEKALLAKHLDFYRALATGQRTPTTPAEALVRHPILEAAEIEFDSTWLEAANGRSNSGLVFYQFCGLTKVAVFSGVRTSFGYSIFVPFQQLTTYILLSRFHVSLTNLQIEN